ncbi:MAG: hypothetical protein IKM08_06220, partial [Clostridia bacterium]|nr:hypothetical protein [Clostridia bacterium]
YFNVQMISSNAEDDLSFNFTYGNTMTSGWNQGGPLSTVKASYYMYSSSGKKWSTDPNDIEVTPFVKIDMISNGTRGNSLGYLVGDQKAMVTNSKFDFVGELDDGTKVYFYETVMGDVTDAKISGLGASVSFSGSGTEITFGASMTANYYKQLTEKFGEEQVSLGVITARAEDAMKAGALRPYLLDAAGVTYTNDQGLRSMASSGLRSFYGSAQQMQIGYYKDTFSAVGYVSIDTCIGSISLYADTAESRSTTQVLASAIEDYSDVRTEEYCYAVENGKWSRYTADQRARFEQICAR